VFEVIVVEDFPLSKLCYEKCGEKCGDEKCGDRRNVGTDGTFTWEDEMWGQTERSPYFLNFFSRLLRAITPTTYKVFHSLTASYCDIQPLLRFLTQPMWDYALRSHLELEYKVPSEFLCAYLCPLQ
jgi:hypothetical protein